MPAVEFSARAESGEQLRRVVRFAAEQLKLMSSVDRLGSA